MKYKIKGYKVHLYHYTPIETLKRLGIKDEKNKDFLIFSIIYLLLCVLAAIL